MNAEQLAEWLKQRLPTCLPGIDVTSQSMQVKHVLNWGGFVNHSFYFTDGSAQYHLKLTNEPENMRRLQAWRSIHHMLERRYRAPELVDWIDFTEIGFGGLVLRHIDGRTADFCANPRLAQQLVKTADCLHHDAEIRSYFLASKSPKTYFDYFINVYIDRFTSDLTSIAADRPPFISSTLFSWMQSQTEQLRAAANRTQAFHNPAVEPVHGDLNEGNILVTMNDWFIIDWDDLTLGDPAVDFAILLWPMIYENGEQWREFAIPAIAEIGFVERMEVCLRAQLLDEVIDTVADYIEARAVPSRQAEVQGVKKRRHEEALKRYTALWGKL